MRIVLLSSFRTWGQLAVVTISTAAQTISPQCNDFPAQASITPSQAQAAGISNISALNAIVALNYERSQWTQGSVEQDDFYSVPSNSTDLPAGSLLRVEVDANTSLYTLPPNTALSRILFQTVSLNGTLTPASAYVLWPYIPRTQPDGYAVVAWAHGNSGAFGECAPSHYRYLLYEFAAPYTLALQGYVVVAPDYQGQGVTKDASGKPINPTIFASPGHANDLFYSVEAAQSAFPQLSKQFVVMGHSEGGGAAWAAAERQTIQPVSGYLGTVAGSPLTNAIAIAQFYGSVADAGAVSTIPALLGTFPTFKVSDILTPGGEKLYNLLSDIQGCNSVTSVLLVQPDLVKPNWTTNFYPQAYQNLVATGGKEISGPMLILQGEMDLAVSAVLTVAAVNATCTAFPKSELEFLTFPNVTHVPVLFASQQIWLQWIEDRFAGVAVKGGCKAAEQASQRSYQYYQPEINWFIELATQGYKTA